MNKGYYAIIPANVRYDKSLTPNAKLLYGEITALCNEKGYCWAGNDYFAGLYNVSKTSISKWVSALRDCGYINIQLEYAEGTKQILHRYITLVKDPIEDKLNTPIEDKLIVNNTLINNTSNITSEGETHRDESRPKSRPKSRSKSRPKFVKPTLDEVTEYCNLKGAGIDPQYFIDFYESKDWMIGKNKMKDWKAAVRTWMRKDRERKQVQPVNVKKKEAGLRGRSITDSLTDRSWAE